MSGRTLTVLGTSSSVGKSLITAALCRIFSDRGMRVAPFKAQNMSNNVALCRDGSQVARAQALQAMAARVEPHVDMSPVLLKPTGDMSSQVVVLGSPWGSRTARDYWSAKETLWPTITDAFDRLRSLNDLVIVEGAGSPVELNLKARDLTNMAIARYAQSPVVLVGDIDRGGVFAQLLGTLDLLEAEERALVKGLVVNRFRGDLSLFANGVRILEELGRVPVLGVVPYVAGLHLPEEDTVVLSERPHGLNPTPCQVEVGVIRLPHISNFDEFDALDREVEVRLRFVTTPEELAAAKAIIIPGTTNPLADMTWLRAQGLSDAIRACRATGTAIVGVGDGYGMLGRTLRAEDMASVVQEPIPGLGLLPMDTVVTSSVRTRRVRARVLGGPGVLGDLAGIEAAGYEVSPTNARGGEPWLELRHEYGAGVGWSDGTFSDDGLIWGCNVHGLLQNDVFRHTWLGSLGWQGPVTGDQSRVEESLQRLAAVVAANLDLELLDHIISGK